MDLQTVADTLSTTGGWGVAALFYYQWFKSEKKNDDRERRMQRLIEQNIETSTRNDVIMERLVRLLEKIKS